MTLTQELEDQVNTGTYPGPTLVSTSDGGDRSVWGSYDGFGVDPSPLPSELDRPQPIVEEALPKSESASQVDWLVMGPSSSGKTTLIAALEQGCLASGDSRHFYYLQPETVLARLISEARESFRQRRLFQPAKTRRPAIYRFALGGRKKGALKRGTRTRVIELPGTPSEIARLAVQRVELLNAPARCLVICLDPTDLGGTRAWLDMLPLYLEQVLGSAFSAGSGEADWLLPLDRVLIVVCKIDLVVAWIRKKLLGTSEPIFRTPWRDLAAQIDPLDLVVQIMGNQMLKRLSRSLGPSSTLAVSLVSSWPQSGAVYPPDREWKPFAIADLVGFLVNGEIGPAIAAIELGELEVSIETDLEEMFFEEI